MKKMKIITIYLPEIYLQAIQILNDLDIYPSRSEAIRVALSNFLTDDLARSQDLKKENFKMLVRSSRGVNH